MKAMFSEPKRIMVWAVMAPPVKGSPDPNDRVIAIYQFKFKVEAERTASRTTGGYIIPFKMKAT